MRHGIVCSWAVALLCACQPSAGAIAPPTKLETSIEARSNVHAQSVKSLVPDRAKFIPTAMTVEELVKLSGNPCDSPVVESQCMNDEDDISFTPDCDAKGYHAVVSNHAGAALLNKVPPKDDRRLTVLAFGKVVCVQAIARIGTYPAYLFVTTDANAIVGSKKCEQVAVGRFKGGCAIGWVDRDDMKLLGNTK